MSIRTSVNAELSAIFRGLLIAWEMGFREIILETDSKITMHSVTRKKRVASYYGILSDRCRNLLEREWIVQIQHVDREVNRVAD